MVFWSAATTALGSGAKSSFWTPTWPVVMAQAMNFFRPAETAAHASAEAAPAME